MVKVSQMRGVPWTVRQCKRYCKEKGYILREGTCSIWIVYKGYTILQVMHPSPSVSKARMARMAVAGLMELLEDYPIEAWSYEGLEL